MRLTAFHLAVLVASAAFTCSCGPRAGLAGAPSEGAATREAGSPAQLEEVFGEVDATFVLLDGETGGKITYDPERAAHRYSPCSTFKIPNTLIGLETGAVEDASTIYRWDSSKHPKEEWWDEVLVPMGLDWARDHDLRSAFSQSVVWFYQDLANRIGPERMGEFVERFGYGNRDISGGLDTFWLVSSLEISANEQVEFLRKVQTNELGLSERTVRIAREVFERERGEGYALFAKTGSGNLGDESIGWYVGWVEKGDAAFCFALNVIGEAEEVRGERVALARAALVELGVLPAPDVEEPEELSSWDRLVGSEVEVTGTAADQKLGAVLLTSAGTLWIDGLDSWPEGRAGEDVTVTGKLVERFDLPVFVQKEGEPVMSGIPVPEGTDMRAASRRLVLEDPEWER